MCNYSHTKAAAFQAASAIGSSLERMKRGKGNIRAKRKDKAVQERKKNESRREETGLLTIFQVAGM